MKTLKVALAALMGASALIMAQTAPAQAHQHTNVCTNVTVTGPYGAYLQHAPTLRSRRYGTAPRGSSFAVVRDNWGRAHVSRGWHLVSSAEGHRYWVHQSVLSCTHTAEVSHTNHNHSSHASMHSGTANPHPSGCGYVRVSAKYAYGKAHPSLRSRTLMNVPNMARLEVIKDRSGHAHHSRGWWLTKTTWGDRLWVHESVLKCDG